MKIKNLILLLIICSITLFTSGCIKTDTEINIDKKGHVVLSNRILVSKQLLALGNMTSEDFYQNQTKEYRDEKDVQKSMVNEGEYTGAKIVREFSNINKLLIGAQYFQPNIRNKNQYTFGKINKNIYNANYKLDWNVNFSDMKNDKGEKMIPPEYADYVSSKLTINIPTKATKTNATNVLNDGLTHVWNFDVRNKYNVQLEFNLINYFNIVLTIIGLLILTISYIFRQSKLYDSAQKYMFGFSGLICMYLVVTQIFYNIQSLSFLICDMAIILTFICLSALSFYLFYVKEKENRTEINNSNSNKEENSNISTDIQTNFQANTKTQDAYLLIVLIGIVVLMIALIAGFLFQDKINNLKGNEIEKIIKNANEKVFDYESAGIENTIYKLMENDYNQIVYFKDKNTGADTYAFRVQTDFKYNSESNNTFNYELGRIIINPNDINKSKYTYNYRSGEDGNPIKWFEGSDKTFVKSIPQIAKLKNEAYLRYKNNEYLNLINLYSECTALDAEGLYNSKCETLPQDSGELLDGWYRGSYETLAKLRSTTL